MCSKRKDTVYREDVINTINKMLFACDTKSLDDYRDLLVACFEVLPSAQPEPSYEAIKEYCRKRCLSIVDTALLEKYLPSAQLERDCMLKQFGKCSYDETGCSDCKIKAKIRTALTAQPEQRCVNCGRTANNGGWYEDGRTRCPIEEHYALPKDGYCHLWEKRKDWEDDYVKRPEEGEK